MASNRQTITSTAKKKVINLSKHAKHPASNEHSSANLDMKDLLDDPTDWQLSPSIAMNRAGTTETLVGDDMI